MMLLKHVAEEIGCPRPVLRSVVCMGAAGHSSKSIASSLDYSAERIRQIRQHMRENLSDKDTALLVCDAGNREVRRFFDRAADPRQPAEDDRS